MEPSFSSAFAKREQQIPVITIEDDDDEDKLPSSVNLERFEARNIAFEESPYFLADVNEEYTHYYNEGETPNILQSASQPEGEFFNGVGEDVYLDQSYSNNITESFEDHISSKASTRHNIIYIIKPPNFKLQDRNRSLIVFASNDKDFCYYFRYRTKNLYICVKCKSDYNKIIAAKLIDDGENEEYIEMKNKHVCKPVKYNSRHQPKMEIINASNFEIQTKQNGILTLVIFVPTNPNLCYYYSHYKVKAFFCYECKRIAGKHVSVKLLKDNNGLEYIEAVMDQHLCEPQKYSSSSLPLPFNHQIIMAPNFLLKRTNQFKQKLIIFVDNDRILCYNFYYVKSSEKFVCNGCRTNHHKNVSAMLLKNQNGEEYVHMEDNHFCEPIPYNPSLPSSSSDEMQIFEFKNFEIYTKNNGYSKLVIFIPNNPLLCYNYFYQTKPKAYFCCGCHRWKTRMRANHIKNEKGDEFIEAKMDHLCEPVEYDIKKIFTILKSPKFVLIRNEADDSNSTLIIYASNNRETCYTFTPIIGNFFACSGCLSLKKRVSAKVQKDKDGEEIVKIYKNQPHICVPLNLWLIN